MRTISQASPSLVPHLHRQLCRSHSCTLHHQSVIRRDLHNGRVNIYAAQSSGYQDLYNHFLEEILQKYRVAVHPVTCETLIRNCRGAGPEGAYVYFRFGEGAIIPYRCNFWSPQESRTCMAEVYLMGLKGVTRSRKKDPHKQTAVRTTLGSAAESTFGQEPELAASGIA